jgi:hypothetical protein
MVLLIEPSTVNTAEILRKSSKHKKSQKIAKIITSWLEAAQEAGTR